MGKHLRCTVCGLVYDDAESIEFAIQSKGDYERLRKEDGFEPKGICPCPVIPCKGELELRET